MKNNIEPIEQLKRCLTMQLEAHLKEDWAEYENLEDKIKEIERYI